MRRLAGLALAVALGLAAAAPARAQAVDREDRACLETVPSGTSWLGTNQLYCLKPDPGRTRRDAFGRCQERRFEVTLKNRCEFSILVRWRFTNGMPAQERALGPHQAFTLDCGQLSERCDGAVIASGEKLRN